MRFDFSPEDEAFRLEVRAFFREHLPRDLARRFYIGAHPPPRSDVRRFQALLHSRGWGAPHWPEEWGGTGWSPLRKHLFMDELYRADGLDYGWQGLHMVAPVILAFGSQAQKRRFLPPMISGEEFWAQGFSEPNAGSDLANLKTQAVLDGDEWVVNGQKIWTSDAKMAEWGFFLVRTDPAVKPQRGISFLLIKLDTPGLTIRPIVSIEGGDGLNEVFLENVRVPRDQIVGEPGMGWTYAKYLLEKERTASAFLYFNKRELEKAREIARGQTVNGIPLIDTPGYARNLARVEVDILALEYSVLRVLSHEQNRHNLDAVVSALKLRGSALQQRVTDLQLEALGLHALRFWDHGEGEVIDADEALRWPAFVPGRTAQALIARASTIYGGSQEVQKNIIAKLAFRL
ncbi:acyl-CoA dehydrogenase family protein [Piscinibacter sp.]|jgi:alkylation response protein AidB-like acyl-CoA dehydrogenase|uniref:acyl-CoA dehydrogenase family protein n=1 Tax=Piscinibacter sp. TaxID=1903157 RepID=UPI002F3EFA1F